MLTEEAALKLKNDVALSTDNVYLQNVLKKLIVEQLATVEALRKTMRVVDQQQRVIDVLKGLAG